MEDKADKKNVPGRLMMNSYKMMMRRRRLILIVCMTERGRWQVSMSRETALVTELCGSVLCFLLSFLIIIF